MTKINFFRVKLRRVRKLFYVPFCDAAGNSRRASRKDCDASAAGAGSPDADHPASLPHESNMPNHAPEGVRPPPRDDGVPTTKDGSGFRGNGRRDPCRRIRRSMREMGRFKVGTACDALRRRIAGDYGDSPAGRSGRSGNFPWKGDRTVAGYSELSESELADQHAVVRDGDTGGLRGPDTVLQLAARSRAAAALHDERTAGESVRP